MELTDEYLFLWAQQEHSVYTPCSTFPQSGGLWIAASITFI